MTVDDILAADFAQELQLGEDMRMSSYTDRMEAYAETGDARGARSIIEDIWRAKIDPDLWTYKQAIDICLQANDTEGAEKLQNEVSSWGDFPSMVRFQMTPDCSWSRQLRMAGCSAHNSLNWKRGERVPPPKFGPCWLLPAQDDAAEDIAASEIELQQAGWKVLTCDEELVTVLRDKAALHRRADALNLTDEMPESFSVPANATYPCVLKPTRGTWGKDACIVYSSEEVLRIVRRNKIFEVEQRAEQTAEYEHQSKHGSFDDGQEDDDEIDLWTSEVMQKVQDAVYDWIEAAEWEEVPSGWVMQELVPGMYEYSTTLLVSDGEIWDAVCSRYEYSSDVYIWPQLEYLRSEYVSVPEQHLETMRAMLGPFSGICNFNYKIRPSGRMCIFEVNPRVGGDLVFDVPKRRVRVLLEKLDAMP